MLDAQNIKYNLHYLHERNEAQCHSDSKDQKRSKKQVKRTYHS